LCLAALWCGRPVHNPAVVPSIFFVSILPADPLSSLSCLRPRRAASGKHPAICVLQVYHSSPIANGLQAISLFPREIAITSILFLVLGDMMAALIGVSFGGETVVVKLGRHSEKSVEGSLAMFLVCFSVCCLVCCGLPARFLGRGHRPTPDRLHPIHLPC